MAIRRLAQALRQAATNDSRWNGALRYGPCLLLPVAAVALLYFFACIVIVIYATNVSPPSWNGNSAGFQKHEAG